MYMSDRYRVLLLIIASCSRGFDAHQRGPSFLIEPASRVEFSNSSGAWLDCAATGSPPPNVDWSTADGLPALEVPGIRRLLKNGTLVLLPFPASAYRQDVHSATYRCVASNSVGRVLSRDVQVRAVVAQAYKVEVEVIGGASRGCTAVLRCVVPSFVRDLVKVVSWLQEPAFYIYPSLQGDGKFHLLPTGELLVHGLEFADQVPGYRCRTMHRLTRQVVVSSVANVRIADHRGVMPPIILDHSENVYVGQDESTSLVCVAQACPTPEYRWYAQTGAEPMLVLPGPRTRLLGPVLAIEAVTLEDSGVYRCASSNPGGEASAEVRLVVTAPLHVEVSPALLSVHLGGSAEFRCEIGSHPQAGPHFVTWYKDGRQLPGTGRQSELLRINSIGREDRGMYQCIVRRSEGDTAQAAAELQLGDAPPVFLYSFIEQTLQPGPAVSLKCSAAGNPTPQITWTLDGFPLPTVARFVIGQYVTVHGDVISHVNISHVVVEDGGEYACTAENRAGKVSHSARLNIYGLPYIRLIPKVTAVAGETLRLKCPVAGYPIEEIRWERAGRELPDDLRQKVQPDGTLVISSVQKSVDSGVYTCWAKNKQGHTARRSGDVAVIVPPIIEPFNFQEGLSEGMRTRTVCGVAAGDPPLSISWLKDGQSPFPLPSKLASVVNVSQLDPYSSLLSISNLAAEHSGDYTCVAANPAAEVRYTAKLQVKVPPRWIVEPSDTSVERNRHVALHCQAQGVPAPNIVWKKATGAKSGEYEELRERPYTKILANGTLVLQHVKEDREGFYLCQASNGIGSGIGKVIQLKVNSAPFFAAPSRLVTVKKADTATLHCEVHGDKPVTVSWFKGGKDEMNPSTNYRVAVKQESTPDGVVAQLQISSAEATDSGAYFCQASNLYGRDQQLVQLLVQEPPQAPVQLETAMLASRSVNVKWQHKAQDSSEISRYILQYKELSSGPEGMWQQQELVGPPLPYAALIDDLKPATRYVIRVIAEGPAGRSAPSAELLVRTEPQRPAGPPVNLAARALSSTELLLSWLPPMAELRHGDIEGFNVGYRESSASSPSFNFTSVPGDGEEGGAELRLAGLRPFTRYSLVVQAYNQVGSGPLSEPLTTQTLEDGECQCLIYPIHNYNSPRASSSSFASRSSGYAAGGRALRRADFGVAASLVAAAAEQLRQRHSPGLQTQLRAHARRVPSQRRRDGGECASHTCDNTCDIAVPPSAPVLYVSSSTSSSILLHWKPGHNGGAPLTKYTLHYRTTHGTLEEMQLSRRSTSHELKGLMCGNTYQLYLSSHNKIGSSAASPVLSVRTQGQPPGIPAAAAFLAPNSSSLALRLAAWPDNGCPVEYFVVQYRPINDFHWTLVSNNVRAQRRFLVTNLAPSSVYQLKVEAYSAAGSNQAEFTFVTLTREGVPPAELAERGIGGAGGAGPFYADSRLLLPVLVALAALLLAALSIGARWRNRFSGAAAGRRSSERMGRPLKESQENQQNAETQRERYYATIHKVALQANAAGKPDKIPETAEDISPYATFQLSEGAGGGLGGLAGLGALATAGHQDHSNIHGNNTLLHSFMYHEHAMTEGCASPPPRTTTLKSVTSRRRQQRKHPGDESDESESDADQLTSSRTESSNQLDAGKLKHIRAVSDFMYHGASSTSSDISPMSEQKSLPRRGRSSRSSLRTILPPMTVAETPFNQDEQQHHHQQEHSCDFDSIKKLKLGLRSSLWSRPAASSSQHQQQQGGGGGNNNASSDYSIAV
ncbi:unnamed protein product [Trichogramma brassicae]|uniref:Down syndrome cell adhesion molecule-like protein Dscam2 n=1 Tax=Trichogramma brassicae TaxID=86971 RepID=A0A6H5ICK6_9HYME|nr:unnamed protein product [Trichogramma brassicae]